MVSFRSAFAPLPEIGNFGRRAVQLFRFLYNGMILRLDVDTRDGGWGGLAEFEERNTTLGGYRRGTRRRICSRLKTREYYMSLMVLNLVVCRVGKGYQKGEESHGEAQHYQRQPTCILFFTSILWISQVSVRSIEWLLALRCCHRSPKS